MSFLPIVPGFDEVVSSISFLNSLMFHRVHEINITDGSSLWKTTVGGGCKGGGDSFKLTWLGRTLTFNTAYKILTSEFSHEEM